MTGAPQSMLHPAQIEAMCELARSSPRGPFVEVGVYKGGSAWHLAKIAREQGRELHLFDTFTGTPIADEDDNHRIGDFGDTALHEVRAAIPDAIFHVGKFPDTLAVDPLFKIAFVHVDCDQYQSVKDCIKYLWPLVAPGGVMLFDDGECTRGCTRAVVEHFTSFAVTPVGRAYVRKS